uniref:72 kDa inositol polyphosphate 5-phosphatase-like n=1 Tax=Saccoglossus kowalevskii TaxID=10224 RepID=A0ABM0N0I7_SACKO|nr:PREDICTED: 72 kDa inositol polyphosphate 5-phosphatase-like [Saccoglossus kowalevskii]
MDKVYLDSGHESSEDDYDVVGAVPPKRPQLRPRQPSDSTIDRFETLHVLHSSDEDDLKGTKRFYEQLSSDDSAKMSVAAPKKHVSSIPNELEPNISFTIGKANSHTAPVSVSPRPETVVMVTPNENSSPIMPALDGFVMATSTPRRPQPRIDSEELNSVRNAELDESIVQEIPHKSIFLASDSDDTESESEESEESDHSQMEASNEEGQFEIAYNKPRIPLSCTMPELDHSLPLNDTWQPERVNSASLSEPLNRAADTFSERSFMSTSILPPLYAHILKQKSYLVGGVKNTGSLLGTDELEKYFPERQVKIFVSTWNMHGEKLLPRNLHDLLLPTDLVQDIYVLGLQEATPFTQEWEIQLQEILGPSHVLLHSTVFGVLHLAIYVRREYIWFCSRVEEDTVATRPGSMIKTKGAIGLSFNFFGTSFLFITSHFTSDDEKVKERMEDYKKICVGLQLPKNVPLMNQYTTKRDVITRFDHVFWCGDLNFRINKEISEVHSILSQLKKDGHPNFQELLKYDQLTEQMKKGNVFEGFKEGQIAFFPTYKFDLNSDTYDSSSKKRTPSYTDRILYRSKKLNDVHLDVYNSCSSIKISDHRAVYAVFSAKIRPGKDSMPVSGGVFNRNVFLAGNY